MNEKIYNSKRTESIEHSLNKVNQIKTRIFKNRNNINK